MTRVSRTLHPNWLSNPKTMQTAVPQGESNRDSLLIARVQTGDREAARDLYDAHVQRVYGLAFRIAGDRVLAAELTQDVFVQLFRALPQFRGESSFTTWLHRVATTTCLNAMRRIKRFRAREGELSEAEDQWAASSDVEPDLRDAIAEQIDALPPPLRIALVMHALEGYSHAEIGAALGIAEGTSKSRVSEARARIRKALVHHLEDRNVG